MGSNFTNTWCLHCVVVVLVGPKAQNYDQETFGEVFFPFPAERVSDCFLLKGTSYSNTYQVRYVLLDGTAKSRMHRGFQLRYYLPTYLW